MLNVTDLPPTYVETNTLKSKPPKYETINGVTLLNPCYNTWQEQKTTVMNAQSALPIISTLQDYLEYNDALKKAGVCERPLSDTTIKVLKNIEDNTYLKKVGIDGLELYNSIQKLFSLYEIPIGFLSKLYELEKFQMLEFVIDDSFANDDTVVNDSCPLKIGKTSFETAIETMKIFIEILAYVPIERIQIKFFNRRNVISIIKKGQSPTVFIDAGIAALETALASTPTKSTTHYEAIKEALDDIDNEKVAKYFLFTSFPVLKERKKIEAMIFSQFDTHFLTIICFDGNINESWNKELRCIPFLSIIESFVIKKDKVLEDQGESIPFSRGFYLMLQLLSMLNPKDLDLMHGKYHGYFFWNYSVAPLT
ncbi:hypothetical protein HK099_006636 [Clydaea vesicula]|uniref:Uncharacterized protein n=1 Tax=Clydaea vesicula TaxID=447962 RepID=A0AAD5XU55_9FUNG|nr:hypothetical protein HK099_006636 [Clydaea vesicula]